MELNRLTAAALPVLAAAAIAGCGSSSSSTSPSAAAPAPASGSSSSSAPASAPAPSAPAAAAAPEVTMQNLAYAPTEVKAKVGDTIKFVNNDSAPHNITHVSGPDFTASPTLSTGGTFSLKLTKAGTIHYYCTIHPFMKATIVVAS